MQDMNSGKGKRDSLGAPKRRAGIGGGRVSHNAHGHDRDTGAREGSPMMNEGHIVRTASKRENVVAGNEDREARLLQLISTVYKEKKDWMQDRTKVWERVVLANRGAAYLGTLGTLMTVAQNEMIMDEQDPLSQNVNIMKILNSLATLLLVIALFRTYWVEMLFRKITSVNHKKGDPPISKISVLSKPWFWVEVCVCGVHLPPFTTFEAGTYTYGSFCLYRGETLLCLINTLRVYLFWRVMRDNVLSKIPKRITIQQITGIKLNSIYVLKRLTNDWMSVFYLCVTWVGVVVILGYWYRSVEITACLLGEWAQDPRCNEPGATVWSLEAGVEFTKYNDVQMFNAIWLTFIVATKGNNAQFKPST